MIALRIPLGEKKRTDYLWASVTEFPNLELAFRKAARGKRKRQSVAAFEAQLETNLLRLQAELQEGRYQPGKYLVLTDSPPRGREAQSPKGRRSALCVTISFLATLRFVP